MNYRSQLYMYAIMPDPQLSEEIHALRIRFAEKYKFIKALKPPVHITLIPPFGVYNSNTENFERRTRHLQDWADQQRSFSIKLENFAFFNNIKHPVIFIDVVKNKLLSTLNEEFKKELEKHHPIYSNLSLKPHITIGYKDVTPESFSAIKMEYSKKNFSATFNCNALYLWKHDGKNWRVCQEYKLNYRDPQLELF